MLLNDFFRNILLVFYCLLSPVEVWAHALSRDVEIRITSEVKVREPQVVLGDVATIYSKSLQNFHMLSALVISAVPKEAGSIKIPKKYLENRVREALAPGSDFLVHGPEEIAFLLEPLGSTAEDLALALLQKGKTESKIPEWVETQMEIIEGAEILKTLKLSEAQIEPAYETRRWKGELPFRIGEKNKMGAGHRWIKVKFRWFVDAWVAKKVLRIQSEIKPQDFSRSRIEITSAQEDPILGTENLEEILISARAKKSIAASSPLTVGSIERAPDVRPGQNLKVVFVSENGIKVTTDGAVMAPGSIGAEIRAKLRTSKKIVTGKLISNGVMEVGL